MSKRKSKAVVEPEVITDMPEESGPPTAEELGGELPETGAVATDATATQEAPPAPAVSAPDCSSIVANLDRQATLAWPEKSPFQVDWPWTDDVTPVPGDPRGFDIVGWNWRTLEIAVVTAVPIPGQQNPWPYTMTVEIRPMPEEWDAGRVRVVDLASGKQLDVAWYTRWNRAYQEGGKRRAEGGEAAIGTGRLGVVQLPPEIREGQR